MDCTWHSVMYVWSSIKCFVLVFILKKSYQMIIQTSIDHTFKTDIWYTTNSILEIAIAGFFILRKYQIVMLNQLGLNNFLKRLGMLEVMGVFILCTFSTIVLIPVLFSLAVLSHSIMYFVHDACVGTYVDWWCTQYQSNFGSWTFFGVFEGISLYIFLELLKRYLFQWVWWLCFGSLWSLSMFPFVCVVDIMSILWNVKFITHAMWDVKFDMPAIWRNKFNMSNPFAPLCDLSCCYFFHQFLILPYMVMFDTSSSKVILSINAYHLLSLLVNNNL